MPMYAVQKVLSGLLAICISHLHNNLARTSGGGGGTASQLEHSRGKGQSLDGVSCQSWDFLIALVILYCVKRYVFKNLHAMSFE